MLIRRERPYVEPTPKMWPSDRAKPTLACKQLPYFRVRREVLERYLAEVYNIQGYNVLRAIGASNLVLEYNVKPCLTMAWNARTLANRIRCGQKTTDLQLILNVLCMDGFIPEGIYLIDTRAKEAPHVTYRKLLTASGSPLSPSCLQFRNQHQDDAAFNKIADQLDKAVNAWLERQG